MMGMQNGTISLEDSLSVSYKANLVLPYNPVITLLDIYPSEKYVHTQTCTWLFIEALFPEFGSNQDVHLSVNG